MGKPMADELAPQGGRINAEVPVDRSSEESLPGQKRWSQSLHHVPQQPQELSPQFPLIAQRFEAWWAHDCLDRPILIGSADTRPDRPITRRLELLASPEEWLAAKVADMQQLQRVGEALPNVRVDFGPVLLGSLVGGEREVGANTSWTHAFIDEDWSNAPDWSIADDNEDWQRLLELLELTARDAAGRYFVCMPDLGGCADTLLNLRGSENLCLDTVTNPTAIERALDGLYPTWHRAFTALYDSVLPSGAGLIHWLQLWSDKPYVVPACDFKGLVGPAQFDSLFLPDIARQTDAVPRSIFHLDGPDAARHIDALLSIDSLDAVQFTPGAGTPSTLPWIDMFQRIQASGRSVLIMVHDLTEIPDLLEQLRPEGLALFIDASPSPQELDAAMASVEAHATPSP